MLYKDIEEVGSVRASTQQKYGLLLPFLLLLSVFCLHILFLLCCSFFAAFLTKGYTRAAFWFEMVKALQKVCISAITVFFSFSHQLQSLLAVLVIFICMRF